MRMTCVFSSLVVTLALVPAPARGEAYSDRETMDELLDAVKSVMRKLPHVRGAGKGRNGFKQTPFSRPFDRVRIIGIKLARVHRAKQATKEEQALRKPVRDKIDAFVKLVDSYRATYERVGRWTAQADTLKKRGRVSPANVKRYNALLAALYDVKPQLLKEFAAIKDGSTRLKAAAHDMARKAEHLKISGRLKVTQVGGFVPRAATTVAKRKTPRSAVDASSPKAVRQAVSGSIEKAFESSACTPTEYRKARLENNLAFLDALAGKLIVWRVMVIRTPEAQDKFFAVAATAGSVPLQCRFPRQEKPPALTPGASIVVAGALADGPDTALRVLSWANHSKWKAGVSPALCTWSDAGAAANAKPVAAGAPAATAGAAPAPRDPNAIVLKSGELVHGKIMIRTATTIMVKTPSGTIKSIKRADIESMPE